MTKQAAGELPINVTPGRNKKHTVLEIPYAFTKKTT
jgi:hypothetical protein